MRPLKSDQICVEGFFARYFRALDGPEPLSALRLVSPHLRFALLFALRSDERARQFVGGVGELEAFTEAGDMRGWSHRILHAVRHGSIEIVLGETRWDDDERYIGTFTCAAELDGDGRMVRYLTARSPSLELAR
jgi:hypothetical protein